MASTRPRSSIGAARWRSFEAVEFATLEWVNWFNNRRLLEPIGNIPPAEAEQRYYAMLDNQPWQRNSTKWPPTNPGRFRTCPLTTLPVLGEVSGSILGSC